LPNPRRPSSSAPVCARLPDLCLAWRSFRPLLPGRRALFNSQYAPRAHNSMQMVRRFPDATWSTARWCGCGGDVFRNASLQAPGNSQTCIPATHDLGTKRGEKQSSCRRRIHHGGYEGSGELSCLPGPMCGMEGLFTISVAECSGGKHASDRTCETIAWNDLDRLCNFAHIRTMNIQPSRSRRPCS
jgi:hypothetical protein